MGQDQYPALGEVRETAKLLPRGESPWWRDEGRHLLILCLFSIRGMRLAHTNNAKSREHAHTCRKARAIFKVRYKTNKQTNELSRSLNLTSLPDLLSDFIAFRNQFSGSVDLTRLPAALVQLYLMDNQLSGPVVLTQLPSKLKTLYLGGNQLKGPLNLTSLPDLLSDFIAFRNQFSGSVDLTRLPAALEDLRLSKNQLTGPVVLTQLPDGLRCLYLRGNQFNEGGDGEVASAGLRAQRRNIDPRSRRLAGHRPDGWPSLDGGSV